MKSLFKNILLLFISAFVGMVAFTSCEKDKMPLKKPNYKFETDSVTDVDGNKYRTVRIGDQWWMMENLRVRNYRDESPIYYDASFTDVLWANLTQGAYCNLYDRSLPFNGHLYNWYAINDPRGLAPEGWRIPSDEDWKKLELFIGMEPGIENATGWRGSHEGEKLKLQSKSIEWTIEISINNNNQSGFSALPGGCRIYNGSFGDNKYNAGIWWSSSVQGPDQAWYRYLAYNYAGVFRHYAPLRSGFSVRCVKDVVK